MTQQILKLANLLQLHWKVINFELCQGWLKILLFIFIFIEIYISLGFVFYTLSGLK